MGDGQPQVGAQASVRREIFAGAGSSVYMQLYKLDCTTSGFSSFIFNPGEPDGRSKLMLYCQVSDEALKGGEAANRTSHGDRGAIQLCQMTHRTL